MMVNIWYTFGMHLVYMFFTPQLYNMGGPERLSRVDMAEFVAARCNFNPVLIKVGVLGVVGWCTWVC